VNHSIIEILFLTKELLNLFYQAIEFMRSCSLFLKAVKVSLHFLIVICITLLNACSKPKVCKNGLAAPVITTNSPVTAGDTLVLSIPHVENASYSWFGKFQNFFDSNLFQPPAFDTYLSGQYKVQYSTPDCISDLAATDVLINPVTSPCSYQMNHGELINGSSATFTNIDFYASNDSTEFTFQAYSTFGNTNINLEFGADMKPQNGVYTIVHDNNPKSGQIFFTLTVLGSGWDVYPGKIYINTVNGKLSATWCNLPCKRYWDGSTGIISGNLTEP
jgi:hypothetical protein